MILKLDKPSYGWWIRFGRTTTIMRNFLRSKGYMPPRKAVVMTGKHRIQVVELTRFGKLLAGSGPN